VVSTTMTTPPRITAVEHLGDHPSATDFQRWAVRDLNLATVLDRGGVIDPLHDVAYFAMVTVDLTKGTICWPNGVDLDPDVLHGDAEPASGTSYEVLGEHHLRRTG
jgi:Protein of unknown function (DUF2442)